MVERSQRIPLPASELSAFLDARPPEVRKLVRGLRRLVRGCAPGVVEAVRFGALCYFRAGQAFGAIGGNICMIEAGAHGVRLSFIHGTSLPDPDGLLEGTAKVKRFLPVRSMADLRRAGLRELIRAAARSSRSHNAAHGNVAAVEQFTPRARRGAAREAIPCALEQRGTAIRTRGGDRKSRHS